MEGRAISSGQEKYWPYWGKARPDGIGEASFHRLAFHALDVAACGHVLLRNNPRLRQLLAAPVGMDSSAPALVDLSSFLLALHDLGKFSRAFQSQRADLLKKLQGGAQPWEYAERHDTLGYALWSKRSVGLLSAIWPEAAANPPLARLLKACMQAMTGHHGQPPKPPGRVVLDEFFAAEDIVAARAFATDCGSLFLPAATREQLLALPLSGLDATVKVLSWWWAGLAVLADWLGSNQRYFVYQRQPMPLSDYWDAALGRAERAVNDSGLGRAAVHPGQAAGQLFPQLQALTPLQEQAARMPLATGPQLHILEDVTGAGKTEAALLLAYRLLAAGEVDGLYFALPTTATANGMFTRLGETYRRFFAADAQPSLVLAHSSARFQKAFRDSVLPLDAAEDDPAQRDTTASSRCAAWLADNRKKALLAQVGVGTIDQALQAVLPNKHQPLRLLGLLGKLLIVDEVHACDAYMRGLLAPLLKYHAMAGGSAILLTATLPLALRDELLAAFAEGRRQPPPVTQSAEFPMMTSWSAATPPIECALATRPELVREIGIRYVSDLDEVERRVEEARSAGQCLCWIRNTVDDAVEAWRRLRKRGIDCQLFHARFALGDRLRIEQDVLDSFGRDGRPTDRAGKVLIATQVVEQSLDLDFDCLISDLAPIDALLQRAGRLHRHQRPELSRGQPELVVLGPPVLPGAAADWFLAAFPRAQKVYPDHGRLWLTASQLTSRKSYRMPDDARVLCEAVYGSESDQHMPSALEDLHWRAKGEAGAEHSLAGQNALRLEQGYEMTGGHDWWSDIRTPTRLGDDRVPLRLVFWRDGAWVDWEAGENGLHLSQVAVRADLAAASALPNDSGQVAAWERKLASLPDRGQWSRMMALTPDAQGEWGGRTLDKHGRAVDWRYSAATGLLK